MNRPSHPAVDADALPPFLTSDDLQKLLQVGDRTLHRWVDTGYLPAPIKLNGRNRWCRDDVRAFLGKLNRKAGRTSESE